MSLASIAALEEARAARGMAAIADTSLPIAGGVATRGTPGSWINTAVGLGLAGPVDPADVDRLIDFHASAGIEPRIELAATADPTLFQALSDRAFVLRSIEYVFARELRDAKGFATTAPYPEGLTIEVLDKNDHDAARLHASVAMSGFVPEGVVLDDSILQAGIRTVLHPETISVLARIHGTPAGSAAMALGGRVAGLFGASVLPEFRRRGIQQALLAARLRFARELGATLATIGSRPDAGTERNVRRMGFFLAYAKPILVRPGQGLAPNL